jgi:hypothetical protein|nr:MAG TPA: hypothetical protein [Caudoviricetes sp.]
MGLELNIRFSDIPDTNEIHEKLADAKLRMIKEQIQEAVNRGDDYCWVSDKILDVQTRDLLEKKGYVLTYNFSDYQISW